MAFYLIADYLNVGIRLYDIDGFDIICYRDSFEFRMERCLPYAEAFLNNLGKNYEKDLRECLNRLHDHQIVHKDIKPANLLYCPSKNKFVFVDYGVS